MQTDPVVSRTCWTQAPPADLRGCGAVASNGEVYLITWMLPRFNASFADVLEDDTVVRTHDEASTGLHFGVA